MKFRINNLSNCCQIVKLCLYSNRPPRFRSEISSQSAHQAFKAPKGIRFIVKQNYHRGAKITHSLTIPNIVIYPGINSQYVPKFSKIFLLLIEYKGPVRAFHIKTYLM
uniref:Uncharacterized protein n=1 Tax=Opuntia streptacantha TaxID=393608 RepID=A0A7C9EES1_OPUST